MKKDEKLEKTKEKIIIAAEKLMNECVEPSDVTSRSIAKEAGVQLAMINYCFGSREALLYEAFCRKEDEYKNHPYIKLIISSAIPPKEKLRRIHYAVADFFINEFKFTKALTGYVLLHRDFSKGLNSLPFVIAHYNGRRTEQECKIISYELSSVMQLAICRHKDIKDFSGFDLTDVEQLHSFIDLQINLFMKD